MPEPPFDYVAVQQRDEMAMWRSLATIGSWTGAPLPVPPPRQFRGVAVDTMGGEAASDSVEVGG